MDDEPTDAAGLRGRAAGDVAEAAVAAELTARGWQVLARNVHVGRAELDLVAVDPGPPMTLVVIEVRWRASRGYGLAEETVDHRKRTRVRSAAYGLLDRGTLPDGSPLPRLPLRLDLVVVEPPRDRRSSAIIGASSERRAERRGWLRADPCYTPARSGADGSRAARYRPSG